MRTIRESTHHQSSGTTVPNYCPSVPLSVYRDLAAELKATQAKLDTVTTKNQKLVQENHLLRQEIAKVVKSVFHLRQWANIADDDCLQGAPPVEHTVAPSIPHSQTSELPTPDTTEQFDPPDSFFTSPAIEMPVSPEPVYLEEQQVSYYPTSEEKKVVSGWWLVFCILLIIFTAFGTGYLIVRPFFQNNSR